MSEYEYPVPRPPVKADCKRCLRIAAPEHFTLWGEVISPSGVRHIPAENNPSTLCGIPADGPRWWWKG